MMFSISFFKEKTVHLTVRMPKFSIKEQKKDHIRKVRQTVCLPLQYLLLPFPTMTQLAS